MIFNIPPNVLVQLKNAIGDLDTLLASTENGDTASRYYDYREFVLWKGDLYVTSTQIESGTAFSGSNLIAVSDGGFNELQSRIGNLFASYTVYYDLDDLIADINKRLTGEFIIAKVASTLASTFYEATVAKTTLCIINKASSNNAYYLAVTQDAIAIGNISLTSDTVSITKDLAIKDDVDERLDNLYVSGSTAYSSLSSLVTYLSARATGDVVIARLTSTLATSFFQAGTSKQAICYIIKGSSSNAYFLAFTNDVLSVGNISLTASSINILQDIAKKDDSLQLCSSVTFPAYLTCGFWRTGSDGIINLNFPCTSLKESSRYTSTNTISLNMFEPGSTGKPTQVLNKTIDRIERVTPDCIVLQLAAVEGFTGNRMGFFSTRTAMTITAS